MKNIFLLVSIVVSSLCYAETKEDMEREAAEKLENAWDSFGLGAVSVATGLFEAFRGNPVGGAVAIGFAVKEFKDSVSDFVEACDLSDRAREMDPESWGNREYDRDSRDNNYDRD